MAARAESNGGANMKAVNNSTTRAATGTRGITMAATMAATRTARTASQAIITVRRGYRSAISARNSPPGTQGR